MKSEMNVALALCGVTDVEKLDREALLQPGSTAS
jgi:isopentenyl diphosphate isomerase/L-lactate dehydrogenase-like FMN-dependent dehydrogenase